MSLFSKIDIGGLVNQHVDTLYDYGQSILNDDKSKKLSKKDLFAFFGVPVILSAVLISFGIYFKSEKYVDIAIKSLSLFTGLLFSLLVLVFNLGKSENKDKTDEEKKGDQKDLQKLEKHDLKLTIIKELFSNIAFAILTAIICIIAILSTQFSFGGILSPIKELMCPPVLKSLKLIFVYLSNGLAIALIFEFIFVLFMILRRFGSLFNSEFDQ